MKRKMKKLIYTNGKKLCKPYELPGLNRKAFPSGKNTKDENSMFLEFMSDTYNLKREVKGQKPKEYKVVYPKYTRGWKK